MSVTHPPKTDLTYNVCNQSARAGVKVDSIYLHDTESRDVPGLNDLRGIASWFNNPRAQASSHLIIDAEGKTARCVPDDRKAWTQANYNSRGLSIEAIGFARLTRSQWLARKPQLEAIAQWVAHWCRKYGIAARHLASYVGNGVYGHDQLGAAGGGHHDPGNGFPWDVLMTRVRVILGHAAPKPGPRVLHRGMSGDDVKAVQVRINRLAAAHPGHYPKLALDGDFGPSTERTVKRFQSRHGLTPDGVVGSKTREALWRFAR